MASIESILKLIVDRPGLTAAELGDELDIGATDVQSRLVKYIESGHVKRDKKKVDSRDVWTYFPAQSLVDEADGVKRVVVPATTKRAPGGGFIRRQRRLHLRIFLERWPLDRQRRERNQARA